MLHLVGLGRSRPASELGAEDDLLPLAEAAAGGDREAAKTLLTVLGPHLLRVVRRVIGANHPDVEDVTQECAVELVSALPRFRRQSSVKHFACRVALLTAMNARRRLRTRKREFTDRTDVEADETEGLEAPPDAQAASRASLAILREVCDDLPRAQSEVLALHCALGYTVSEVAAICGVPLETVRSRLRLGKQALVVRALRHPRLRELLEETA
jgi:RNA polymerase sigma-70 factor (ECF subfamily)